MKFKIAFLFIILLFLVACKTSNPDATLTYNFKQGYGNLVMTTLENAPPQEIYQDYDFKIIVKLENQGGYDLTYGKVSLLGFNDKYITLEETEQEITNLAEDTILAGKNIDNPLGEFTYLEFPAHSHQLLPGMETYSAPYFIKTDYQYRMEFTPTVCINPNLYDIYDTGCKVESPLSFAGQGAPVAITKMEEIISPGSRPSIEFRFIIQNKGKGRVNSINLETSRLGDQPFENCYFIGTNSRQFTFRENNQETVLICSQNLNEQKSYLSTLFLAFNFDYSLKEQKTITLKGSPQLLS